MIEEEEEIVMNGLIAYSIICFIAEAMAKLVEDSK